MRTAIAILNYSGAALLRQFLPSVLEHSKNTKVYVIDNGSTDDSLAILAEDFPSRWNRAIAPTNSIFVIYANILRISTISL